MPKILVSVSGGKDSTATLLVAMEQFPHEDISAVFCDTGNEHEFTYDYVRYLEDRTGVPIHWLKQDFTDLWWRRAEYVRQKWPVKLRNGSSGKWKWTGKIEDKPAKKPAKPADIFAECESGGWEWSPGALPMAGDEADAVCARVLAFMDQGPTGNPYLDLCIIKGRFPSRKAQFCTQYLKTEPATEYALELIEQHGAIESWQGVRAEESPNRANLAEREDKGGGLVIVRPIHKWTAAQVFAQHDKHGVKANPLYKLGMGRVGCMPCINARKDEVLEISKRFPEHIDRIEEWESLVAQTSKRQNATFFPAPGENDTAHDRGNIRQVVQWSKTKRGGRLYDMFRTSDESPACSSSYGLCE